MATMQLRPMAMGEILDASFALLRRHAGVFFGVAIVCQGLPTGLSLYVQFSGGAPQNFWLYVASQLLSFIGYLLVTGASIRVVSQAYLGNEPSLSDALDFAFGKIGRTLAAGFASGILSVPPGSGSCRLRCSSRSRGGPTGWVAPGRSPRDSGGGRSGSMSW